MKKKLLIIPSFCLIFSTLLASPVPTIQCDIVYHPTFKSLEYYQQWGELHFTQKDGTETDYHLDGIQFKKTSTGEIMLTDHEDDNLIFYSSQSGFSFFQENPSDIDSYYHVENCKTSLINQ